MEEWVWETKRIINGALLHLYRRTAGLSGSLLEKYFTACWRKSTTKICDARRRSECPVDSFLGVSKV